MLWGVVGKPQGSMEWIVGHISAARTDAVRRLGGAAWAGAWRCFECGVQVDGDWPLQAVEADNFPGRQGSRFFLLLRPPHLVLP